jgi:hypothetical protein
LEQLDCRKLDLLVPPLCGSVRAGDQPHPVDPTEVAIDEGVAHFRAVLRAHGQAEVSFGVVVPRARLEVGVLVVARGWRSMTTRSTTQRVAAGLLAGSRARGATSANTTRSATSTSSRRPPDRRADAQPLPQPILRRCVTQPAGGDDLDLTAPGGGRGLLRGHYRGARRHQPGQRRAVDLVGPRSCGSPWRPSSRSAGVLPSRIRRKLTRPGQPIAMRNSSTSAIARTTGRRPSTSAPSSPRSTRSSSPRRQTCRVHARRGTAGRRRMLARMEHDRWMAARKQPGVPTARNGPPECIPTCETHRPHLKCP